MRKIIDRFFNRLSPPEPPATVQSLVFNVPIAQIAEWTEDTLKEWLRVTGTPADKIQEKALDIRVLGLQAGVSLKEPRRVWNKFTVGNGLSAEELCEQQDAICKLLGFGDVYNEPSGSEKDGIWLYINTRTVGWDNSGTVSRVRLVRQQTDNIGDILDAYEFPVVDNQLDLDEIRAAIAKLKEQANENK